MEKEIRTRKKNKKGLRDMTQRTKLLLKLSNHTTIGKNSVMLNRLLLQITVKITIRTLNNVIFLFFLLYENAKLSHVNYEFISK